MIPRRSWLERCGRRRDPIEAWVPAPGGTPCESCSYGYAPVTKGSERHAFCMVDDKQVDCTKNPKGCPECAKQMKK